MEKFSKIGKRVMALFIVALLNINAYATQVSNDGSAFVTKAEFDTMMKEFNANMDTYQSGLNAKIDAAISGYLGGLAGESVIPISPAIDKNGKLPNGKVVTWCSNDQAFFGSKSEYRVMIESSSFQYVYVDASNNTKKAYSNKYSWDNYDLVSKRGYPEADYSLENRKYLTSKMVKIKLDNGTELNAMQRMKVKCEFKASYEESKQGNYTVPEGWQPGANFASYVNSVHQNSTNLLMPAGGLGADGGWMQNNSVTVNINDIADLGEVYDYEELLCPLSTKEEMYWDPLDFTSGVSIHTAVTSESFRRPWNTGTNHNWKWPYQDSNPHYVWTPSSGGGCSFYDGYEANWMKKKAKVQDMYLYNFISQNSKNRQVKNGIVLGDTVGSGDYYIHAQSNIDGTLYCYINKTPISNWTATSFAGEKVLLEDPTKEYILKINTSTVEKGVPIWICFLPSDTSINTIGTLKINDFYLKKVGG